jgi:pilus assembly protein CpaE
MSETINALVALDSGVDRGVVESMLPVDAGLHLVDLVEGLEESWCVLQSSPANLLLVACGGHSTNALVFIESAVRQRPDRPIVVLCSEQPNGFVRRVFDAGADDIVVLSEDVGSALAESATGEILFTMQKALARRSGAAAGTALGELICVIGPKGGIGKTLTSANLAASLADEGHRVVVVDLDLQFGDVGLSLGLTPEKTIYDLANSGGSLDAEKIEAYLAPHESGVRVLLAPMRPDHAGAITVDFLRDVYAVLRSSNDYVIVDTPPGFTPEVIASIDSSTRICMVGMLDSLSLKNTKLGLETLDLMGYDRERIRMVLNRADSHVGISYDDVLAIVGRPPDVMVPSNRDIARSINEGKPIVLSERRSDAARAFRSLADIYTPKKAAHAPSKSNGRRFRLRRKV